MSKINGEFRSNALSHRADADWLSEDICREYREKALKIGCKPGTERINEEWRTLRDQLMHQCDIAELMAEEVLLGQFTDLNIASQNRMKKLILEKIAKNLKSIAEIEEEEFEDWKYQKQVKEECEAQHLLGDFDIEE